MDQSTHFAMSTWCPLYLCPIPLTRLQSDNGPDSDLARREVPGTFCIARSMSTLFPKANIAER